MMLMKRRPERVTMTMFMMLNDWHIHMLKGKNEKNEKKDELFIYETKKRMKKRMSPRRIELRFPDCTIVDN